jgi:hypothetical protein
MVVGVLEHDPEKWKLVSHSQFVVSIEGARIACRKLSHLPVGLSRLLSDRVARNAKAA